MERNEMACVAADELIGRRSPAMVLGICGWCLISVMGGCGFTACGQTARRTTTLPEALGDPRPSERVAGVAAVGRVREWARVPELIEMLDDPNPAVRLTAGATLRDLTGYDTGYQPWDDVVERRVHLQAWRRWWVGETPQPIVAPRARPAAGPRPEPTAPASALMPLVPGSASEPPNPGAPVKGLPPPVIRVVRRAP